VLYVLASFAHWDALLADLSKLHELREDGGEQDLPDEEFPWARSKRAQGTMHKGQPSAKR